MTTMGEWLMERLAEELGEEPKKVQVVFARLHEECPESKPEGWNLCIDGLDEAVMRRRLATDEGLAVIEGLAGVFVSAVENVPWAKELFLAE